MGKTAMVVGGGEAILPAGELAEAATSYAEDSKAASTRRAYGGDWRRFAAWCEAQGLEALPAEPATVALYAAHLAGQGRKVSTVQRALTAIAAAHRLGGHESPTREGRVREVVGGIRRRHGAAQKQAAPVSPEQLRAMVATLGEDLRGLRDRALLALGFAGAFRRSELVALDVADLDFGEGGLTVTVRRSKTDQAGEGARVGIPYGGDPTTCPVRAVRAWLEAAGLDEGPAFPTITSGGVVTERAASDRAVDRLVKRTAKRAGLGEGWSAHSLRAGLATTAARAGKGDRAIMRQGRWRSRVMVDRYVREGELFTDNAAAGIGI